MSEKITLGHGSGGKLTQRLIDEVFKPYINSSALEEADDAAVVSIEGERLVTTTDGFTVRPLFFPGGDIGKLAVCGTVNDLVVCGAMPRYLTAGFIIEEGFEIKELSRIVESFSRECARSGVEVVAADTKVVERGKGDGVFITVAGIGSMVSGPPPGAGRIAEGDLIIVSGDIGDHGAAIVLARGDLNITADISSDCASLHDLALPVFEQFPGEVKFMRDATRGGVATVLNEVSVKAGRHVQLVEEDMPVKPAVEGLCEMLGMSPWYLANEGTIVLIVDRGAAPRVLKQLRSHKLGKNAAVIGEIGEVPAEQPRVYLQTRSRGKRILDSLISDQLPRIC
jgi:hydrogenase expression/formation protein HypE